MNYLLLSLITAHLIADFMLQTKPMLKFKQDSWYGLVLHCGIVMVITILVLGYFQISWLMLIYPVIFLGHLIIDGLKKLLDKDGIWIFVIDQILHIALLTVIAKVYASVFRESIWAKLDISLYYLLSVFVGGLILCVFTGGIVISKATKNLVSQIIESNGLKNGGQIIGWLERALIFFFVLTGQMNTIGFLFAAKSILRFGEIKDPQNRKEAEYIIIGTFMSFGWALVIGYFTSKLIRMW